MKKNDVSHNPHDRLARKVFGTPHSAADLFKHYAGAEVRKTIRWSKLKRLPKHEFGKLLDEHINDGAFTAPLTDGSLNANALILFEHKSYSDPSLPLQVGTYLFLTWTTMWNEAGRPDLRKHPLPAPVIVLLHHGPKPYKPLGMQDIVASVPGLKRFIPQFDIAVIDLTQIDFADLKGEPLTRATLEALKRASDKTLTTDLVSVLEHFRGLPNTKRLQDWLLDILYYADCVQKLTKDIITKAVNTVFDKKGGDKMATTLFEELKTEGKAESVITVLEARFGTVPKSVGDAVHDYTNPAKLDALTRLAATCASIDEFKRGLK